MAKYKNENKRKKNKKIRSGKQRFFISFGITTIALVFTGLFLLYGPIKFFRDTLITTAYTTQHHKYLADMFYSPKTIQEVLKANSITDIKDFTDPELVKINDRNKTPVLNMKDVKGATYRGYLLEISNPAWVRMGISNKFGRMGQRLQYIVEDYNALAGINASGFVDPGGHGRGEDPVGLIVQDGKIINPCSETKHKLIAFDEDDKMVLGNFTNADVKRYNIREGAEFGPFLIVNNKLAEIKGDGGWGYAPRTAIGQKADGTVLFLIIDGRQPGYSIGATMKDVQNIMRENGAINAANLDGGSSSSLQFKGELINKPSGPSGERYIPNAFLVVSPSDYQRAQNERSNLIK